MKKRGQSKITKKQLISTGILDDFFQFFRINSKGKKWRLFTDSQADRIASNMNYLMKDKVIGGPAQKYLTKLKNDMNRLSKIKTNKHITEPMRNNLAIKIKVGSEYCRRFRKTSHKDYEMDLFLWDLYQKTLYDLKSENRLEIMADIYLIMSNPPQMWEHWKQRHPTYFEKGIENVKKRLQRIPKFFKEELQRKEYKDFERRRIKMLNDSLKNIPSQEINPLFNTKAKIKKYIRNRYLANRIDKEIKKNKKQLDGLNILEIYDILKFHKIKLTHEQIFNIIIQDNEFLNAFRIVQPKK